MKNALFVLLVISLLASACIVAPATPEKVIVVVTATPKASVAQPQTKTSDEAHRLAARLPSGWHEDGPPACPDDSVCMFNAAACSYIMFHEVGSSVDGVSYGVDFMDSNCEDGSAMSDAQYEALMALGMQDAFLWLGENVPPDSWDGTMFTSACGSWYCSLEMDTEMFLILHVWFR